MTELYKVCDLGNGSLSVMPKPNPKQLQKDIKHYQQQGVTQVISLLLPTEIETLAMQQEPHACQAHGIEFIHFPIQDMAVPNLTELKAFNQRLKQALENGHHLAIHCHGGRGRAGTVAITLMVEHGFSAQEAIHIASNARGDRMPVNELQVTFVNDYQVD